MTGWTAMDRGGYASGNSGRGARSVPFGPWGVAALAGALGALAGLLIPMAWIEEVSWQLYLDQIIAAARPPLGVTARLAAVVALALGLGLLGWLTAMLLGVRASGGSVGDWFAGLRGRRVDDEPDAPTLRAADRHPDAPARRPFSAVRDVPVEDAPRAVDPAWSGDDGDGDELLLDAHFDEQAIPVVINEEERAARWDALDEIDQADEELVLGAHTMPDEPDDIAAEPVSAQADVPPPAPLDLSVARLDELIARLEAGLTRREAAPRPGSAVHEPVAPTHSEIVDEAEPVIARGVGVGVGVSADAAEPSFPQDPALAAALATLRRMNRAS